MQLDVEVSPPASAIQFKFKFNSKGFCVGIQLSFSVHYKYIVVKFQVASYYTFWDMNYSLV